MRTRRLLCLVRVGVVLLVLAFAVLGCHRKAAPASDVTTELPVVTDTSSGLLLTWIDERGEFHVEQNVASVPATSRDLVRVVDPSRDPPAQGGVFLADVRAAGADGHYPVRLAERDEFESVAAKRRGEHGAVLKPQQATTAVSSADDAGAIGVAHPTVIIYGASWCGPCHQAQAYLRERGIPFVYKDIEADPSAAREMHSKLAAGGIRDGSIPVIDVSGKIFVGFDPRALARAL
ncbi:MAG: glutaredoxin family protein [Polyangiaceae bacterium]|nr:glutaredoxin family protein [Polyangiaceae bacterium]